MRVSFSKTPAPAGGVVIVPGFEDSEPSSGFRLLDERTGGALGRAAKASRFTGKKLQVTELVGLAGLEALRIVLVGAGKPADFNPLEAERIGGAAITPVLKTQEKSAALLVGGFSTEAVSEGEIGARMALGAVLRAYRFDKYRTKLEKDQKPALDKLVVHSAEAEARARYADFEKIADGVFITRDLVSEPPNILHPESFAERCRELESLGIKVTVLGEPEMKKLGMHMLLAVGMGSARESRLVAMEWMGGKKGAPPLALVGKGVTFDSGGISLKPGPGMDEMKWDMGGAGAVTGAMAALAGRKARANVVGVIGLVENMPDGLAQRPGDVVSTMSGQTVEILNTDAEGRLVLGDAVWWTQEKFKPRTLIDLATLTGAIIISLGHESAGLFSKDEKLSDAIRAAARASGDDVWPMPITSAHHEMLKSDIADMKNIGPREAGSSTAAAFIGNFIKDGVAWAHLDIAGMAWSSKDRPTCPKGGTGFGVRLLDEFVRQNFET